MNSRAIYILATSHYAEQSSYQGSFNYGIGGGAEIFATNFLGFSTTDPQKLKYMYLYSGGIQNFTLLSYIFHTTSDGGVVFDAEGGFAPITNQCKKPVGLSLIYRDIWQTFESGETRPLDGDAATNDAVRNCM